MASNIGAERRSGVLRGRLGLVLSCALLGLAICALACGAGEDPPNIVLIIGDDHGYPDFGFMGSSNVETPALDRLAAEGALFPNAYLTHSICAPSLNSLLTGFTQYQINLRLQHLQMRGTAREPKTELQDFTTLPALLGEAGFATFQGGKITQKTYALAGFAEGLAGPQSSASWAGGGPLGRKTMEPVLDFIDRNRERPFFLWFAPLLPHLPHDAPPEFERPFEGRGFSRAAVAYYANILRFDRAVAELIGQLEESGLREKTLIVYLADNGWDQGPRAPLGDPGLGGPKGKKTMYELGFRTPIVISRPGSIPAGAVHDELVSSLDLFPTLLDYAGVPKRPERPGRSLRPLIEGTQPWGREYVVGGIPHVRDNGLRPERGGAASIFAPEFAYFVRTPDWHYIWYQDWGAEELFDIRRDPLEERDVARKNPHLVGGLRATIEAWKRDMERSARAAFEAPERS